MCDKDGETRRTKATYRAGNPLQSDVEMKKSLWKPASLEELLEQQSTVSGILQYRWKDGIGVDYL